MIIRECGIGYGVNAACVGHITAARRKGATLDDFPGPRRLPRNGRQPAYAMRRIGQARHQAVRVGMSRVREKLRDSCRLDDPARVHHGHAVDQLCHHAEVMGNEEDREAKSCRTARAAS